MSHSSLFARSKYLTAEFGTFPPHVGPTGSSGRSAGSHGATPIPVCGWLPNTGRKLLIQCALPCCFALQRSDANVRQRVPFRSRRSPKSQLARVRTPQKGHRIRWPFGGSGFIDLRFDARRRFVVVGKHAALEFL